MYFGKIVQIAIQNKARGTSNLLQQGWSDGDGHEKYAPQTL